MAGKAGQEKLTGIFRYLEDRRGETQWDVRLVRTRDEMTVERARSSVAGGLDGFIVSIPGTEDAVAPMAEALTPTVAMDIHTPALAERGDDRIVFIRNAGEPIGRAAADCLVSQGVARSYAFLHAEGVPDWSRTRCAAFRKTLAARGLGCEEMFEPSAAAGLKRPAAVFAANDDRAVELMALLKGLDVHVPKSIAVMGVDNDTLVCENVRPRLSSVQPDFQKEGYLAAQALDSLMRGESVSPRTLYVGVATVAMRESTAPVSQAGKLVQRAVAFIDRHAVDGIGVEDVVNHLKCSRRLADLRFRQLQGRSILEAITEVRLENVKRLLADTGETCEAIAYACGYENPNYLKNLFKRRFSMTMGDFRRSVRP